MSCTAVLIKHVQSSYLHSITCPIWNLKHLRALVLMHWSNQIKSLSISLRALNGTSSFCEQNTLSPRPAKLLLLGLSISWSCSQLVVYQKCADRHQVKYLSWWRLDAFEQDVWSERNSLRRLEMQFLISYTSVTKSVLCW